MAGEPIRVLLIQSWVIPRAEIRDALRAGGYEPTIYRVDHEPGLAAALAKGTYYDVVLLDPRSGVSRPQVEALMKDQMTRAPIVETIELEALGDTVRAALGALRN